MRPALCLCAELTPLELETRLVVVMHRREARQTTNTGRLAAMSLARGEVLVRGDRASPLDPAALAGAEGRAIVLFPSEDAAVLDAALAASLRRPVTLVVPDGCWRQTRHMVRHEAAISGLPRVKLPPGPPGAYRLRHGAPAGGLSTLEAVARALGVLEGPDVQALLEARFARVVERVLWSRGQIAAEDCAHAIPEKALAEGRATGRGRGGLSRA
jgi:DTW domain-containing protein YfiP